MSHIIIPNASDFAKVGKIYQQIGISSDEMQKLGSIDNDEANTLAISLTNDKKVKATNANWNSTFINTALTQANLEGLDTSNVTNMNLMFYGASSLNSLDVSNWDTSNVTDMYDMFNSASDLTSLDVSKWDTSNVTDMGSMFSWASGLTSLDVSKWDTSNVTDMSYMFNYASGLKNLDVSKWDTSKVTDMSHMFYNASSLALIANSGKFADYLVNHDSFAGSNVDSNVKSVTTDNTKLLQLLTSDVQHNSATRTIVFTFPANYSPDLAKYHLTKANDKYQIKQSADYDKSYLQGTVLINATYGIAYHHIDTTKPYKLSDTWQPNYDKLVLAHKNSDGSVSFDAIQLPHINGYKAYIVPNKSNPALFTVSFVAVPIKNKPSTPVEETPSKPSANPDKSDVGDLRKRVVTNVTKLNSNNSDQTMSADNSTCKMKVPVNAATIDLSDLVITQPVHAQTRTQTRVNKRFKLRKHDKKHIIKRIKHRKKMAKHSKKHVVKHFKHRKKVTRQFKKYRL